MEPNANIAFQKKSSKHKNRHLRRFFALGLAIALLMPVYWLAWVLAYGRPESPGVAGDMFGGLTALFTGLAFAGVVITMLMQNEDLRLQRDELAATRLELKGQREQLAIQNQFIAKQNFETAYFQLLRQLNELIAQISVGSGSDTKRGREALEDLFNDVRGGFYPMWFMPIDDHDVAKRKAEREAVRKNLQGLILNYEKFFEEHSDDLANYFRMLYNIVKFVDTSDVPDKEFYINIVRAQLSTSELGLLFFNGVGRHGKGKMKNYMEQYSLLEHLPPELAEEFQVIYDQYDISAFGAYM